MKYKTQGLLQKVKWNEKVKYIFFLIPQTDAQLQDVINSDNFLTKAYVRAADVVTPNPPFVSIGNANLQSSNINQSVFDGIYTDNNQLARYSLRVVGSECYSQEKGGIYAEAYADLSGPAEDVTDASDAAIGFTRIGDVSMGTSTNDNILLEYNIQNTGPQYVEVQDATHASLIVGEYYVDDQAGALYEENPADLYEEVTLSPAVLAGLGDMKINLALSTVCGQYTSTNNYAFGDMKSTKVVNFLVEATLPDEVSDNYFASLAITASVPQTFSITESQLLSLLRMGFVEDNVHFTIIVPKLAGIQGYGTYSFTNALSVGELLQIPATASKFWKRIKGFFQSAWKVITGVVPKVAKVASSVIPPPYGTVVAGIGAGVTAVNNVINAVAQGNTNAVNVPQLGY